MQTLKTNEINMTSRLICGDGTGGAGEARSWAGAKYEDARDWERWDFSLFRLLILPRLAERSCDERRWFGDRDELKTIQSDFSSRKNLRTTSWTGETDHYKYVILNRK